MTRKPYAAAPLWLAHSTRLRRCHRALIAWGSEGLHARRLCLDVRAPRQLDAVRDGLEHLVKRLADRLGLPCVVDVTICYCRAGQNGQNGTPRRKSRGSRNTCRLPSCNNGMHFASLGCWSCTPTPLRSVPLQVDGLGTTAHLRHRASTLCTPAPQQVLVLVPLQSHLADRSPLRLPPGRLMIRDAPRMPAVCRESTAVGTYFRLMARICSPYLR